MLNLAMRLLGNFHLGLGTTKLSTSKSYLVRCKDASCYLHSHLC